MKSLSADEFRHRVNPRPLFVSVVEPDVNGESFDLPNLEVKS